MKCTDFQRQLGEYIDHELEPRVRAALEDHLSGCEICARELAELRVVDARLRQLTLPPKPSRERLAGILERQQAHNGQSDHNDERVAPAPKAIRRKFLTAISALAACIVVTAVLYQLRRPSESIVTRPPEAQSEKPNTASQTPLVRLVRATGDVEVFDSQRDLWSIVPAGSKVRLESGDRVRTLPSVACELKAGDRGTVRLNERSEVHIAANDRIECVAGQVWTRAETGTMEVQATAFQGLSCPLGVGQCVEVRAETQSPMVLDDREGGWQTKIWQLPLLAIGNPQDPEATELLENVLAVLGATKESYLFQSQLEDLGPPGAIPLLAYVASERSRSDPSKRMRAMEIAAKTADKTSENRLLKLTDDSDSNISALAKKALARIKSTSSL